MESERPALSASVLEQDPLFVASPLPKWVFDDETLGFLAVNPAAIQHYGWSREEFLGMTLESIRSDEDLQWFRTTVGSGALGEVLLHYPVVRHRRRDGGLLHAEIHARAVGFEGRPAHLVVARDVTARVAAEHALRLHSRAVEASPSGVVVTDARRPDHPILLVNSSFERITGYRAEEILGRNCRFLQRDDRGQATLEELRAALAEGRPFHGVLRNYRRNGEMFWNEVHLAPVLDDDGALTHYVGIQNDVTERVIEQMELEYRDRHDELTGLPNRRSIEETLERLVQDAQAQGEVVELTMVNPDLLHHVNDILGYAAGDAVLREMARRMLAIAQRHDAFASRLGGDDFLLVARHRPGHATGVLADAVVSALAEPFALDGAPIHLTASAGTCLASDPATPTHVLIQRVHLAAKKAKQAGRNQVAEFTPAMAAAVSDRFLLGKGLRDALAGRQFELHVQPLVHATSGRLGGGEVLLRWTHPTLGAISPARFVPVAEDTGLIVPLGAWVLEHALRLSGDWMATSLRPAPALSVNVSAVQFRRRQFVRDVLAALEASGRDGSRLKLEITEGVVMEDADQAIGMLRELRAAGVRVSLDDFGTGHSSLGYLRTLPLDEVKIDRLFVRDVTTDAYAARLCAAIVEMSQQLGLAVVAEGVETPEQAAFLRDAGCDLLQGFLFSRPLPADAFRALSARDVQWTMDGNRTP